MATTVESTATTTTVEPTSGAAAAEPNSVDQKLNFTIIPTLKEAQNQNGLQDKDYARYRQFCSQRIYRLRKQLKFNCGKTKFEKKVIIASTVKDVRFLLILLFQAERAWSHAMEIKRSDGRHVHYLSRLGKAARVANNFAELCSQTNCSELTRLEAKAYASWLQGLLLMEKRSWEQALESFVTARYIFNSFVESKLPSGIISVYQSKVEEIDPSIRFCSYSLDATSATAEKIALYIKKTTDTWKLDKLTASIKNLSLSDITVTSAATKSNQKELVEIPLPNPELIAVKPIFFDIAINYVAFPEAALGNKIKKNVDAESNTAVENISTDNSNKASVLHSSSNDSELVLLKEEEEEEDEEEEEEESQEQASQGGLTGFISSFWRR